MLTCTYFIKSVPRPRITRPFVTQAVQALYDYFTNAEHIPLLADMEPKVFWQSHSGPVLQVLEPVARMLLGIPASSADVERIFSTTGFLLEGRESLSLMRLEQLSVIRVYITDFCKSKSPLQLKQKMEELVQKVMSLQ